MGSQPARPDDAPWFPVPVAAWPDIADAMAKPWPEAAARQDLRYWASQERAGGRRLGRPALAERWGWTMARTRALMGSVECWWDHRMGPPPTQPRRVPAAARWTSRIEPLPDGSGVYLVAGGGLVKLGFSTSMRERMCALQTGSPHALELLGFMRGDASLEVGLHSRFAALRKHGEWFADAPEIRAAFGLEG